MKITRSCFIGFLALLSVATTSSRASATWLGLADGSYDVTLTCVTSTVISCPSTIEGTMTIAGSGATAFDFIVNGQDFIGAPVNGTATSAVGTDQFSRLDLSPFSTLALEHFLSGGFPGLTQDNWDYCNNAGVGCTPLTNGNWTVPEPPGVAVFVLGIVALAGVMRRLQVVAPSRVAAPKLRARRSGKRRP